MSKYAALTRRAEARHGDKFDASDLAPELVKFYESGDRIKVRQYGEEITGTVGVTTGWRPVFLLMRRSNAHGSSYTLAPGTFEIVAVKRGRAYV